MIMVSHFDEDFRQFPCKCGSKNCIGYIVREGSRWRVKKIKNNKNEKNFIYKSKKSILRTIFWRCD